MFLVTLTAKHDIRLKSTVYDYQVVGYVSVLV